jgi:hypothetical protein
MGLSHTRSLSSKLHHASCFAETFGRKFQSLSTAEVLYNFCSSSLMTHHRQNRSCVLTSGNYNDCHCNELLELRLV